MPTVQGTIYRADGTPVSQAQRMRWYKEGVLIKDFYSDDNGDYCTVLAAGGYCVVIAAYAANPPNYTVTTVPLQTQDFRRTTNPPNCVRYEGAILGSDGEPLTGESQFMQWLGDEGAVVAEFWTPPDGEYSIRLPFGSYRVKINGVEVGEATVDPCGAPHAKARRLDFTCPGPVLEQVRPAIAKSWPAPLRARKGDVCVYVDCSDPSEHVVQVDGEEAVAAAARGMPCACFADQAYGKHRIKVKGAAGVGDEIDLSQQSKVVKVKCKLHAKGRATAKGKTKAKAK